MTSAYKPIYYITTTYNILSLNLYVYDLYHIYNINPIYK